MSALLPFGVLVVWGMIAALDLVSVPQGLLSRPLVVGTVAGWLAGDLEAGLRVGVLFECFALDVLPIGAVRYPDYGPATVAAVALSAGVPWEGGLGVAAVLGLVLAAIGGWSMQVVRRSNARAIQKRSAALAAGEGGAIRLLQYGGLFRDALRGATLTAFGLAVAMLAWQRVYTLDRRTALGLSLVAIGGALSAVMSGAVRSAGRGARLRWLIGGSAIGLALAALA